MRRVILRNSASGMGQQLVRIVLLFVAVPLFIKDLGPERYGIFSLLSVLGNLNGFVGLGLNTALTKYVAEQGKSRESDHDFIVTVLLQVALLLPASLVVIFFGRYVVTGVLGVPAHYYAEVHFLFVTLVVANGLILIGQSMTGVLDALQRVDLKNYLQLVYNLSYWSLILVALFFSPSLASVGAAILLSAILWFVLVSFFVFREYGKLEFTGFNRNFRRVARKQVHYGARVYAGGLIGFFYEPLSKILVSHFIGVTDVGFFDIALRLRSVLWGLVSQIFYPLFPLMSQEKDKSKVRLYVHDIEQKVFLVVLPLVAVIVFALPSFVNLWLRQNGSIIAFTSVIIISFHLVGSSTVIPNYQFLLAKDLPQKTIILQSSNVIFNSAVFLATVHFLGYYALILANMTAITSSFLLSLYYQHRYLQSLIFDSRKQLFDVAVVFLADLGVAAAVRYVVHPEWLRIGLIPMAVVFSTILMYRWTRLVKTADVDRYLGKSGSARELALKVLVAR